NRFDSQLHTLPSHINFVLSEYLCYVRFTGLGYLDNFPSSSTRRMLAAKPDFCGLMHALLHLILQVQEKAQLIKYLICNHKGPQKTADKTKQRMWLQDWQQVGDIA
ncbi:hypothetical protein STEG23_001977, partial [Scotinomys teguina]